MILWREDGPTPTGSGGEIEGCATGSGPRKTDPHKHETPDLAVEGLVTPVHDAPRILGPSTDTHNGLFPEVSPAWGRRSPLEGRHSPDSAGRRGKGTTGHAPVASQSGPPIHTVRGGLGRAGDGHTKRDSHTQNVVVSPGNRANSVLPRSAPASLPSRDRYFRYITGRRWHERRQRYFATFARACAFCGATKWVELHHHTYARMGRELDDDLLPVCDEHHEEIHAFHRAHPDLTLTEATRAVAGQYEVQVIRRRPREELSRKERNRLRKARRRARREAQLGNNRGEDRPA